VFETHDTPLTGIFQMSVHLSVRDPAWAS
jgi:hypothetical protein